MQKNYNENLVAGAAIRDDKGRRISKLFEASHPKMTVGYAKNLIMPDDPTEQEFNFRQAGGGVIEDGVAVIDKVKGKSLVWNQLFDGTTLKASGTSNGITFTYENGVITANGTATATAFSDSAIDGQSIKLIKGHKYIFAEKTSNANAFVQLFCGITEEGVENIALNNEISEIVTCDYISSGTYADGWSFRVRVASGTTLTNAKFRMPFTDLTQMFGAGNEPTTYEEFLQRKPKVADEYAYNEGTIVNNKVEKVVTTGRNIWDEQIRRGNYNSDTGIFISRPSENYYANVNPIKVLGGKDYYHYTSNTAPTSIIDWYDADMNFIGEVTIPRNKRIVTSPSNACFANFWMYISSGISLGEKCCINLSDPTINGKYFPYEEHTLDLSWVKDIKDTEGVKLFEDGLKSVGSAFDEAEKGRAIKRVGSVDLGGLNFSYSNDIYIQNLSSQIPNIKASSGNTFVANILIPTYITKTAGDGDTDTTGSKIIFQIGSDYIFFKNSGFEQSDIVGGKIAKLEGQYLYYELAEPIEVEYDEKSLTYPVVAGGTEETIASEPSSAFRADIGYGIDAVKTILDLKARVEALEAK